MISKKFLKSSIVYTMAGALPMASAVILLPFYIGYLPPSEYGKLSVFLSFTLLIQLITAFSFDAAIYLYFHEFKKDPEKLRKYIGSAFILVGLSGMAVTTFFFVTGNFIFSFLSKENPIEFYPFGVCAVATSLFQVFFKIHNNILQTQEKAVNYFWSNVIFFSLVAGLTIGGLVLFPGSLVGPIVGRMVATIFMGVWALFKVGNEFGFHFDLAVVKETLSYNLHSWIYQLQQWVITYLDRFVLLFYVSLADLGVYDLALKCLIVIDFIITGFYFSFFPKVVKFYAENDPKKGYMEINKYYHGLTAATMILVSGAIFCLPELIDLFISKSGYVAAIVLIPFAGAAYLAKTARYYFAMPYTITKNLKPLPIVFTIVSSIKVVGIILVVPSGGMIGAISVGILITLLENFLLWLWIRKQFSFVLNAGKILFAPLMLLSVIILAELSADYLGSKLIAHGIVVFACGLLIAWFYKRELPQLLQFFRLSPKTADRDNG